MVADRDQTRANKRYYSWNRERELARVKDRQAATVAFLRHMRERPCHDCGRHFAPHQMDFDHRDPMLKGYRVTEGRAMLKSRQALAEEIAKCDVVCANCHRIRTQARH